jgi:SSS family solute:Na+ symporter
LIAVAWILNAVAGTSKPVGCAIAAVIITTYFTLGGLHATARVNVLQLTVKLAGFVIALLFLLNISNGLAGVKESAAISVGAAQADSYLGFAGKGWPSVIKYLVTLAPSFLISPGLLQKLFGARDERAVRVGVGVNALALLIYAIVPVLMGVIARGRFPDLANREVALPMLLTEALPFWLGALLLGAIFSAELSASDAAMFMLSTSLSKDLYKAFINPAATDARLMLIARWSAVGCGVAAALLGILLPTVITALTIFYTLLVAALLLPLIAGLYTRKVDARAATATMIISVGVTFALELITSGQGVRGVPSLIVGIAAGATIMLIATVTRDRKAST